MLKNYQKQQSSSIYNTLSLHRSQVPKVLGACEIYSNMEFRYQIIISAIKFRKGFAKIMILVALFKKFLRYILLRVLKSATWSDALTNRMC